MLVFGFICSAFGFSFPTQTQYSYYDYDSVKNPSGYTSMDTYLTWKSEPTSTWGYYAQNYFQFTSNIGGYYGLQKDPNGKRAIFSMWDQTKGTVRATSTHPNCKRFDHEGDGTMCFAPIQWKAGTEYRINITKSADGKNWTATLTDTSTNVKTVIGSINVGNASGFVGYGNLANNGHITTLEYYMGDSSATCNQMPYFGVGWRGPFMNNGTVNPMSVRPAFDNAMGTKCPNVNAYSNSLFSVTQESGASIVQTSTNWSLFWNYSDYLKYNKIDCFFNWAEKTYPQAFNQAQFTEKRVSKFTGEYYYRDYRNYQSDSYALAASKTDFYLVNNNKSVILLGNIDLFTAAAKCS